MSTTTVVHALTCPVCGSNAVEPTVREWANCQACGKGMTISDAMTCDCWGYECLPATTPAPEPEPGNEYPFSVSDIARTAAHRLGKGWAAESGPWGVTGVVSGPYVTGFTLSVDYEGDLCIEFDPYAVDGFPESPELPEGVKDRRIEGGLYLECASASDGLDALADKVTAAIRAASGYDPDDFDFTSSASRQHHSDTGKYLRTGHAEAV